MTAIIWRPAAADRFTPGRTVPIDTLVFHTSTTSFDNTVAIFQGGDRLVSAGYVVDRDQDRIAQCVNDWDTAWHAGNWPVNQRSIGIERADYGAYGVPGPDAQLERIVWLARKLMADHPIKYLLRHDQTTQTACPDGLDTPRIFRELQGGTMPLDASDKTYIDQRIRDILLGEPQLTATALKRFFISETKLQATPPLAGADVPKVTKADVQAGHGRG